MAKKKKVEKIVKEESNDKKKMTLKEKLLEIALYLVSYTITLLIVESCFKSFTFAQPKILFAIIATLIIYVLNKVVRPIIVTLTMPLTGITFGLFYVVINCFILKVTDWVMFSGMTLPKILDVKVWILFFISIILAILRFLIEDIILKPIVRKAKALKNE